MPAVNKIDSNITGLAYAEEAVLGFLPGENGNAGTPVWKRLEPNSYSDFGGEIKMVAPNPITPSRQRRKGVSVDIDAMGGFNHNLSFYNLTDLMQGALFASLRKKGEFSCTGVDTLDDSYDLAGHNIAVGRLIYGVGFTNAANNGLKRVLTVAAGTLTVDSNLANEGTPPATARVFVVGVRGAAGDLDIVNSGTAYPVMNSTALNFTTLGLVPGQWVYIGGDVAGTLFVNPANNGFKRIRSISANQLVFDKSSTTMVTEASTTETVHLYFGDVLKNEIGNDIVRRSYNVERTLGVPDSSAPAQVQAEVLTGAVVNEVTFNIPQAELINVDFKFMAIDNTQRTGVQGPKQTNVLRPFGADIFNSTSDVPRMRVNILNSTNAAPTGLFAFVTEATLTLTNNVSVDKAVGVFGGFDMTTGMLEIGGSLTAYFSTVEAIAAIRNSSDVTIDIALVRNNKGMILDLPLVALGDGRLNVEQDAPITLPLKMDAATAVDIDTNLDYTMMITYFNYLPTIAG